MYWGYKNVPTDYEKSGWYLYFISSAPAHKWPSLPTRGLYFEPKTIFFPHFLKMKFFPLSRHAVIGMQSCPISFNSSLYCSYLTLLLFIFSFLSPFPPFLFVSHFPSHFSPSWPRLIFRPPGGGGGWRWGISISPLPTLAEVVVP